MLAAFSVTPLGVGDAVAEYVADAVRVVRDSGLPNRTDAMFTTVEGDWDEVMDVVKRAVEAVAAKAPRVSLTLKADVRPGVTGALEWPALISMPAVVLPYGDGRSGIPARARPAQVGPPDRGQQVPGGRVRLRGRARPLPEQPQLRPNCALVASVAWHDGASMTPRA